MKSRARTYGLKNPKLIEIVEDRFGQRNHVYVNHVPDYDGQIIAIREAAGRIRRGLPLAMSIDNFLHTHQADTEAVQLARWR